MILIQKVAVVQKGDIDLIVDLYLPQRNVIGVVALCDEIIMKGMIATIIDLMKMNQKTISKCKNYNK